VLVDPTVTVLKSTGLGETLTGGAAVPLRFALSGLLLTPGMVTDKLPVRLAGARALGVKVIEMEHVLPG